MDDIIANKIATLQRCLERIRAEFLGHETELEYNYTKQDSIILNLQRACEASVDLGTRVIRLRNFGLPQSSRDVFFLLEQRGVLSRELSSHLQAMVGFRNIAVHDYQKLNLLVVRNILKNRLQDFEQLIASVQEALNER